MELTAENTAIVLDSTVDFPQAPERFENWRIVPLYVSFGDESFRDYVDLGPDEFYRRLGESSTFPTTSQPTPGDFLAVYDELGTYERVLSLHISSRLSGTAGSAEAAAAQVEEEGKVRVFDTRTVSVGVALLALAVQRRLERGTTDEEIAALVASAQEEGGLLFTVDTLEHLQRGGRIGRAQAFAGQLLHIRPILGIDDGEVVPVKRVRGSRKAFAEFTRRFTESTADRPGLRVGIAHANAPAHARALEEMVARERPQAEIELVTSLGAVVGAHGGPGTVGFFWLDDPD